MYNRFFCYLVNSFLCLSYKKEFLDYRNIEDIKSVQTKKLNSILRNNVSCEYGQKHDFAGIRSVHDFQKKVPLTEYEDYKPYIERIAKGEKRILTSESVLLFELSSGSTTATKRIPYTSALKEEFQRGIKPWLYDLYTGYKGIKWGNSYWSITPAATKNEYTEGNIPIGFEDDKEYFGKLESKLLDVVFAVPSDIVKADNMEEFYFKTALGLLKCKELTLISVWNPTFLLLVLTYMEKNAEKLIMSISVNDKKRAKEVRNFLYEKNFKMLWKNLKVISCWCDGNAKEYANTLHEIFPQCAIQPKGLLATEGFVSFPMRQAGGSVLSINSHFFEFSAVDDNKIYLADELQLGRTYSVILTTSGGFYRYKLKDVIQVKDFMGRIPVITFLGKQDKVSDLFGEKLNEIFVKNIVEEACIQKGFFMVAPEINGYVLYIQTDQRDIAPRIEKALRESFHYDYCRRLGQLQALRVFRLTGDPLKEYLEESVKRGQRLGNIKPVALHLQGGWDQVFKGEYE